MEDRTPLEAIHRILPEIEESRQKCKTIREQLKDVTGQNEDFQQLQEEVKELTNKRAEGRKLLMADKDYQKVNADLEDERIKLKDLQEILSHYLVSYYNETKKTQITDPTGDTRQVILSARIGKTEAGAGSL
jgi:predicted  nucleic acid-binding Zn-ribbon protein